MEDKTGKIAIDILKTLYHSGIKIRRHVAQAINQQYQKEADKKMKMVISELTGEIIKEK